MRKKQEAKSFKKTVLVDLCVLALVCAVYSREQQNPKYRVNVTDPGNAVLVRINVVDPLNRFVTGLERDDFRISENGRAQTITYFAKESAPLSLAIASHFTEDASLEKRMNDAIQSMIESARPEDEFFLVSYNFQTGSVETTRRQSQTMDRLPSTRLISGLNSLEQVVLAGIQNLKGKSEKRGLAVVTGFGNLPISRAYDLLFKVESLSDLPGLQLYTLKREGSLPSAERSKSAKVTTEKSYVINNISEIGYYLDLVYSDLRSQYILGYAPTASRPTGKNLKVNVDVSSRKRLPKLTVRLGEPYYAQVQ